MKRSSKLGALAIAGILSAFTYAGEAAACDGCVYTNPVYTQYYPQVAMPTYDYPGSAVVAAYRTPVFQNGYGQPAFPVAYAVTRPIPTVRTILYGNPSTPVFGPANPFYNPNRPILSNIPVIRRFIR